MAKRYAERDNSIILRNGASVVYRKKRIAQKVDFPGAQSRGGTNGLNL
jgi:hypothetical protein